MKATIEEYSANLKDVFSSSIIYSPKIKVKVLGTQALCHNFYQKYFFRLLLTLLQPVFSSLEVCEKSFLKNFTTMKEPCFLVCHERFYTLFFVSLTY